MEFEQPLNYRERRGVPDFDLDVGTFILAVDRDEATLGRLRDKAQELGLDEKHEFHITIMNSDTGSLFVESLWHEFHQSGNMAEAVEKIIAQFAWTYQPKDEFYFISQQYEDIEQQKKETRKSIIQMVDLPELDSFYKQVNGRLGRVLKHPPAHITLFTTSTDPHKRLRGIGIDSEEKLKEMKPEKIEI